MKKGFTLIELLAVIIILAIIALIAIPLISGVVDKARMGAAKNSAYGVLEAADLFNAVDAPAIKDKMAFTCDGEKCSNSEGKTLKIKGTIPTSGNVVLDNKKVSSADLLVVSGYCFDGERENLKSAKNCYELDTTKSDLSIELVDITSTNLIVKVVTSDLESKIKEIKYEIDGKEYIDAYDINELAVSKKIEGLKENAEYILKVTVTNENNLSETKTLNVKTDSLGLLLIKYENTPNTDLGVYQSEVAYLDYNKEAKGYYVKSGRNGVSNISPKKECGNGNVEGECQNIEDTTTIEANKWYYFDESPRITFAEEMNETSSIYARATDGYNVTSTTSGTISAIDRTKPTCGDTGGGKTNWTTNQNVSVGVHCVDNIGCVQNYYETNISGHGQTGTASFEIADKAGNTTSCGPYAYNKYIDTTTPQITIGSVTSNHNSITISFTVSTNSISGLRYSCTIGGVAATVSGTKCTRSGLSASTTYSYSVTPINGAKTSGTTRTGSKATTAPPCTKTCSDRTTSYYTASYTLNTNTCTCNISACRSSHWSSTYGGDISVSISHCTSSPNTCLQELDYTSVCYVYGGGLPSSY